MGIIFFLLFIAFGISAFITFVSAMKLLNYLRKHKKKRYIEIYCFGIKGFDVLKVYKMKSDIRVFLMWHPKYFPANFIRYFKYIFNNLDIKDKNIRLYKNGVKYGFTIAIGIWILSLLIVILVIPLAILFG